MRTVVVVVVVVVIIVPFIPVGVVPHPLELPIIILPAITVNSMNVVNRVGTYNRHTAFMKISLEHISILSRTSYYYCRLYESRPWEDKAIKKLIASGKVAPISKGHDWRQDTAWQECPICFLYYSQINSTVCCHANICTECYLQVRPQTATTTKQTSPIPCPFCNHVDRHKAFQATVLKLTLQDLEKQQQYEQEQINAHEQRLQADQQQRTTSETSSSSSVSSTSNNNNNHASTTTFGSYLDQDERVAMFRKRSESIASSNGGGGGGGGSNNNNGEMMTPTRQEVQLIQSMAMTPQERKQLEDEMKNQQLHPLALQIEMEAQQRISQNEQRHYSQQRMSSSSSRRLHPPRDWNSILSAYLDAHGPLYPCSLWAIYRANLARARLLKQVSRTRAHSKLDQNRSCAW